MVFNTHYFSIALLVKTACVTLVKFISIENKENKVSYNSSVGEEASVLETENEANSVLLVPVRNL